MTAAQPAAPETPSRRLSDTFALDQIAAALTLNEWGPDTSSLIRDIVQLTGRTVDDRPAGDETAEP